MDVELGTTTAGARVVGAACAAVGPQPLGVDARVLALLSHRPAFCSITAATVQYLRPLASVEHEADEGGRVGSVDAAETGRALLDAEIGLPSEV